MNIYKLRNYREIIAKECERAEITQRQLALSVDIHTSYFSRVMMGRANFSDDQAFLLADQLDFDDSKREYFLSLLSEERASHHRCKIILKCVQKKFVKIS